MASRDGCSFSTADDAALQSMSGPFCTGPEASMVGAFGGGEVGRRIS
ncbi:MAG: hypothetical protein JSR21_17525 [Proteobacteria bacterium]|nr:hypothetical protein [Pseudomonadota bacterium]